MHDQNTPSPAREVSPLLTNTEAAAYLNVAPRTLEKWRVAGTGPRYCYMGRLVRYRRAVLAAFIEAQERRSTSDQGQANAA